MLYSEYCVVDEWLVESWRLSVVLYLPLLDTYRIVTEHTHCKTIQTPHSPPV
jgi:hypothetical protein